MNEYTILTCCNRVPKEDYYVLPYYFESIRRHQSDPVFVMDEGFGGQWGGLGTKVRWLYKALSEGHIKTEYCIFTDCWDFIFAAPPKEMLEEYLKFNSDLVISTERTCFPADYKTLFDMIAEGKTNSPHIYLNSGLIIGKTAALLELVKWLKPETIPNDYFDGSKMVHPNDQQMYQYAYLDQPVQIKLDYEQVLCGTLHETKPEELDFSEERIKRKDTGTTPCSWHMNGNGKTSGCREYILKHLNLI